MTETPGQLSWQTATTFFKVLCLLGQVRPDNVDVDAHPDLMSQGGTVELVMNATRVRYVEESGRARMVSLQPQTYTIQASTGELIDSNGQIGVYLLDPNGPGLDPAGWTYTATVTPSVGEKWSVTFNGVGAIAGAVDLVTVAQLAPSTGNSTLDARVSALEMSIIAHKANHATGGTDALSPDDIGAVPFDRTINSHMLNADVELTPGDLGTMRVVSLTQAQYDALPTKDAATIYMVTA